MGHEIHHIDVRSHPLWLHDFASQNRFGVQLQDVTAEIARAFGWPRLEGELIARVLEGGAAEQAGMRVGDIVIEYADAKIRSSIELVQINSTLAPGQPIQVQIVRDGARETLLLVPTEVGSDR